MLDEAPLLADALKARKVFDGLAARCPHCGNSSLFVRVSDVGAAPANMGPNLPAQTVIVGYCAVERCRGMVVGVLFQVPGQSQEAQLLWPVAAWPDRAPADVEACIKSDYDEARAVLPLSPKASAVMARRCLQHVIRKRLSIEKPILSLEIEEAMTREELAKPTRDALHNVRELGNWGAHPKHTKSTAEADSGVSPSPSTANTPDPATTLIDVTADEAMYTLETLEMVFRDLYEVPARLTAMEIRIEGKKQGAPLRT